MDTKLVRRSMDRAGTDEGVKQFMIPVIKYSLYVVLIFIIMGLFGIATTSAVAVLDRQVWRSVWRCREACRISPAAC